MEKQKVEALKAKRTGLARLLTSKVIWSFIGSVIAILCVAYLLVQVSVKSEMAAFDPYVILGVEPGTEEKLIKKAYRKLSLKYHPDKNVGDKVAEEMFMKLAKAHDALLDPISRENYEKYGSPDGKQSLEVSIGLPSIILENPKVFLILYLIVMVAVIPIGVQMWYSNSKLYAEHNILLDTYKGFQMLMKKDTKMSKIAEVLSISAEFRKLNELMSGSFLKEEVIMKRVPGPAGKLVVQAKPAMGKLIDTLKTNKLMVQPERLDKLYKDEPEVGMALFNQVFVGNLLLHSHLNRVRLGKNNGAEAMLHDNLDQMLETAPSIVQALIDFCKTVYFLDAIRECIKFNQCLTQAVYTHVGDSPFLQLSPKLKKGGAANALQEAFKDVRSLVAANESEVRRKIAGQSEEVQRDIMEARTALPKVSLHTRVFVVEEDDGILAMLNDDEDAAKEDEDAPTDEKDDKKKKKTKTKEDDTAGSSGNSSRVTVEDVSDDEADVVEVNPVKPITGEDIFEGDLVRLRVTLTRENVREGDVAPPVYAPFYPAVIEEAWWVLLTHPVSGQVLAADRITDQGRVMQQDMRFMAPDTAGDHAMELQIVSENYVGLDIQKRIDFTVRPKSELPEVEAHEEDKRLDDEPTLFEQVMSMQDEEDSSSSDEDSDEDEDEDK